MKEADFLNQIDQSINSWSTTTPTNITQDNVTQLLAIVNKYHTLYKVSRLISYERELDDLLKSAMDKVIEVTKARRGFIALVKANKQIDFKIARNMEKGDIEKPQFEVSRSIIHKVLSDGEAICLPNALDDDRFSAEESVIRLQLLSVLCTPITIDEQIVGLIYVDNSDVMNLFNETTAEMLDEFSQILAIALKNTFDFSDLKKSHQQLAQTLRANYRFDHIIGSGPRMTQILELVAQVADTEATVLIQGENGTGKELIARALHYNSSRSEGPFITVNCAAIPAELIESEIFGHVKGAFTGAFKDKKGKFELADTGTIFLDEIGEMSPSLQVKLLRVLQDGIFSPVGSEEEKQCDVRVIAATNSDLNRMIAEKSFRKDLYYRLNVINMTIPPLRDRREDILLLVDHFLKKFSKGDRLPQLSNAAKKALLDFDYPGNIRQLENIIQRAVILCKEKQIDIQHLPNEMFESLNYSQSNNGQGLTYQEKKHRIIEEFEKRELNRILTLTRGKVREGARQAGMNEKNFSEKLKKLNIKASDYK